MVQPRRSMLTVAVEPEVVDRVAGVIAGHGLIAEHLSSGADALALLVELPFDLVLCRFPLPDMGTKAFLDVLRGADSASRGAGLLLLADPATCADAEDHEGAGANGVVSVAEPAAVFAGALAGLLGVARRVAMRGVVKLKVQLERGTSLKLCQTINISPTGMLIRSDQAFPMGTEVAFELPVPRGPAIHGRARVVRHANSRREGISGMGLQFISLQGDGASRLAALIAELGA